MCCNLTDWHISTCYFATVAPIIQPIDDQSIQSDDRLLVQCVATGTPEPTYQWLKGQDVIIAGPRVSFPVPHILVIDNLVNDDQGIVYIIYFTSPFSNPMSSPVCCIKYRTGGETQYSVIIVTNTQNMKTTFFLCVLIKMLMEVTFSCWGSQVKSGCNHVIGGNMSPWCFQHCM